MEGNRNEIEIDPDYEGNNAAIRSAELKEEQENELTSEKLSRIIQEQFDKDLADRQQQLEEIEDRIFKAQKLLHVARYVIISSYYNNKNLEININEDISSATSNVLTGQTRIHPAVKKLLGKNATNLPILGGRTKRKAETKTRLDSVSNVEPAPKKIKVIVPEPEVKNNVNADEVQNASTSNNLVTNRLKSEYRIIVGNISHSKKSLEQEHLMHKWMVYIKIHKGSSKEGPDLATKMIQKVVFYLHPSYKPHDVVEISEAPFHLSRRGWGEFPLRAQIFFKSNFNKPVDIIHKLKLDQTFVGRQTIGNETLATVFLNDLDSPSNNSKNKRENSTVTNGIKLEKSPSSFEHDYCHEKVNVKTENLVEEYIPEVPTIIKIEPDTDIDVLTLDNIDKSYESDAEINFDKSLVDHSYSLPQGIEKYENDASISEVDNNEPQNKLIYGLGDSYLDVNENVKSTANIKEVLKDKNVIQTLVTASGKQIRFLPQSFSKILLNNGSVVQVKIVKRQTTMPRKSTDQSPTKNRIICSPKDCNSLLNSRRIDREKYKVNVPWTSFKNVGEILPYLFKRLPLWNELAADVDFKCTYPYVARSDDEFKRWNVGKKLSAEWSRAKTIKNLIKNAKFCDYMQWNTKSIFMYGRSHCYTPLVKSFNIFNGESPERTVLANLFQYRDEKRINNMEISENSNDIDIITEGESSSSTSKTIDISDSNLKHECTFIKEGALDCGIILKPEQIIEGVKMNAAERMILEAVKCFADSLVRRARHHSVINEPTDCRNREITAKEVRVALAERPEFRTIADFQRKRMEIDYFFS